MIVLVGDVFDQALEFYDPAVVDSELWIMRLLVLCSKHNIVLRVLEGTPSHDRKQPQQFITSAQMLETMGLKLDIQYVKAVSIEYIEKFGINVLYIPDEAGPPAKTLELVYELMAARGITQVDYAFMHGQFEYQLPAAASKEPCHNSVEYLKIVRELIFIGHIHIHTSLDRIHAQGSFDRLAHGEEGAKGHLRATVYANGERDVVFVENKGAMKYVTVNTLGLDLEESLMKIRGTASDLPDGSYVRVEAYNDNPITELSLLIREYPLLNWSKIVRDYGEEASEEDYINDDEVIFVPITLTKENLGALLIERLSKQGTAEHILAAANNLTLELA